MFLGIVLTFNQIFFPLSKYAPVKCTHCSHLGNGRGIAGSLCGAMALLVPPQCRASDITQMYPLEFTIIKNRAMTLSRSPKCRALSRAVMDGKSLSPLFPVGGGHRLQMTCALKTAAGKYLIL